MQIRYATLVNIGPHRRLEFGSKDKPLPKGTIGIFGPNGSGKTTTVEAVVSALTNKWTGIADTKLGVICDRRDKKGKEKAYVEVGFVHRETEMVLTNSLAPDKISLVIDDQSKLEGWEAVSQHLDLIGLSQDIINAIFLRQNNIDGLFSSTPTVRARLYQKMLMLGDLAGVQDTLMKFARLQRSSVTVVDRVDEFTVELEQMEVRRKEAIERRNDLLLQCLPTAEYEALRDSVAMISKQAKIRKELVGLRSDRAAKAKIIKDNLTALKEETPKWRKALVNTKTDIILAKGYLDEIRAAKVSLKMWKDYEAKKAKLQKAEKELEGHTVPAFDAKALEKATSARAVIKTQYTQLKAMVDEFAALKGKSTCPTCKQTIDNIAKLLKEKGEEMAKLEVEGKKARAVVDELEARKAAHESANRRKAELERNVSTLIGSLGKRIEKPVVKRFKTKKKLIEETRDRIRKRNKTVRILRDCRTAVKTTKPAYETVVKHIKSREADLVDESQLTDRSEELRAQDETRQKASMAKGEVLQIEKSIEQRRKDLEENQKRLREVAASMTRVVTIEQTAEIFHPNRLPLRVSRACLKALEPAINRNIKRFGGGFSCRPTDNLDLMITMPDRSERSISRLSVGQRVVLSICFWLAQLELFAGDIGMLSLDEPTANLDEKNRKYLGEILRNVSTSLRNRLQMIVISHDPLLKPSFDRVVEIG